MRRDLPPEVAAAALRLAAANGTTAENVLAGIGALVEKDRATGAAFLSGDGVITLKAEEGDNSFLSGNGVITPTTARPEKGSRDRMEVGVDGFYTLEKLSKMISGEVEEDFCRDNFIATLIIFTATVAEVQARLEERRPLEEWAEDSIEKIKYIIEGERK